jgi:uncharacterized repeat protein (TIGR04138 family)
MENLSFKEAVDRITQQDKRYAPEAYFFVRDGLEHTTKNLRKGARGLARHVNGKELSEGLCNYALDEYGPLAYYTLKRWGITRTDDFGEIVFALIAAGMLGKTDEDKREDFDRLFDLYETLGRIYEVAPDPPPSARRRRP